MNIYPVPNKKRAIWQSLDGEWNFALDNQYKGEYPLTIQVPYAYQTKASGIADVTQHDYLRYRKEFVLEESLQNSKVVYLNFLAVDFKATVFVNGRFAFEHEGGYGNFGGDIRPLLHSKGKQVIEVFVYDPMTKVYPRGKQNWEEGRQRCWYYPTSGIWQSVWLDGSEGDYMTDIRFTTDVDKVSARLTVETIGEADELVAFVATPFGTEKKFSSTLKREKSFMMEMGFDKPDCIDDIHLWTPEHPKFYETKLQLKKQGKVLDEVETYFSFRKISTENGRVYLNDRPIELRMVLYQGYWEGYGMTAPDKESYKKDIEYAKAMGFNGMRIHQKLEDPWLYYYADRLGIFLWAETPSAYEFCPEMMRSVSQAQTEIIKKVYNHPSVIAYVPLNESWGVKEILVSEQQQAFAKSLYWLIKGLDNSRLVITNDGWENLETSDIIGVHDYSKYADDFPGKFNGMKENLVPAGRRVMAHGNYFTGQPIMLTEFGGVALATDSGWGYGGAEDGVDAFMARFERLYKNVADCNFCGWCYTQLTDIEQETNGLLDGNHEPKFDVVKIKEVVEKYAKEFF